MVRKHITIHLCENIDQKSTIPIDLLAADEREEIYRRLVEWIATLAPGKISNDQSSVLKILREKWEQSTIELLTDSLEDIDRLLSSVEDDQKIKGKGFMV